MTKEDFIDFYRKHAGTKRIVSALSNEKARLRLSGLVGSSTALISAGAISELQGTHLFILNDKEEAAYFLNDLQQLNEGGSDILFFPRSYRVPYQQEQTDNANMSMRAEVLNMVNKDRALNILVSFPEALSENVVTRKELTKNTFEIKLGESFSVEFIDELLIEYGFEKVDYVYEPGQFSQRGGILDVFSFSFDHPYRIEFFGDEVDSIRKFDPVSQLSVNKLTRATIVPEIGEKMMKDEHESFFEFLPKDTVIWMKDYELLEDRMDKELGKAKYHYERLESPMKHLAPEDLYAGSETLKKLLDKFRWVEFGQQAYLKGYRDISFEMNPQPIFHKNFDLLSKNLHGNHKNHYLNIIVAGQPKQIERLHSIFEDKDHDVPFKPIVLELAEGFIDKELKIACYTDHQIFDRYHRFRLKEGYSKSKEAMTLKELNSLEPGDFVVHIDHGVGKFSGLQKLEVNGKEQEAIRLEYKGGDILYVSIHSLHRISRYTGKEGTQPKVNKLGSPAWNKLKSKTKKKVKEIAFDLIKLYAKRKASKGFAFSEDSYLQNELEASFMYEDTPDQNKATREVKKDMEEESPMDRLICGDVGFGKTEIAIRAAFKAVTDGKQVAVLVPTTILSLQHYRNFSKRLEDFPCRVDFINRFKSAKKLTQTFKDLEAGKIDIIIGTHALVGKRVKFKDLGLLIIDEEQKFGVAVKDKLKTFKANVDTLTMTATPIPRTLQFSMMNARDMSVITTPPPNRYPIQTELRPFSEEVIRDAVTYEVQRGGQVYFVHNHVKNIKEVAGMIQRLCPDVRVGIGHGQMDGDKLEKVMTDFMDGVYDVLVATTIIESGIDISNANTMIINEAHNFGLSDLHQLRGRVGRGNKKAFCYLLSPPISLLSADSRKRLQAIEQFSDLGSGINIAMRDLDIRGAGDLLGADQSGFISDIGFDMYHKILNEAIQELKENEFKDVFAEENKNREHYVDDTVVETDFEILIPDEYVGSITERLNLYKTLDDTANESELQAFREELVDRFGPVPPETEALLDTIRLRWLARDIGFEKIILKSSKMIGYFVTKQDSPYYQSPKFTRVLQFIKNNPRAAKMYEKNDSLRLSFQNIQSVEEAIAALESIVEVPELH